MKKLVLIPLLLISSLSFAQSLTDLQLDKSAVLVGQPVQATVVLEGETANCGLRIHWGDGLTDDIKINKSDLLTYKASHTYAKAGDFQVNAAGTKITSHLGCIGKSLKANVKVSAPAPVAVAPAPAPAPVAAPVAAAPAVMAAPAAAVAMAKPAAKASGPTCPGGWKLRAKSVNKKTKAFTCTAKAGTPVPDVSPSCPGNLTYFANSKKGVLGCRP